jgi:replication factor C subunit 3/5
MLVPAVHAGCLLKFHFHFDAGPSAVPPPPPRQAKLANRNLRRATLCLEACRVKQYPFTADQEVELLDWEKFIGSLARDITQEQSPARLMLARGKLYELLTNCIPADVILKTLNRELMHSLDDELKHEVPTDRLVLLLHFWALKFWLYRPFLQVTNWAAYYEHRLQLGSKEIYHLEAFIAKFMSLYRQFLVDFYG